jgi:hypothetical protein
MTENNPFDALRVAYEQGQRDAIAAAVQRVKALAVNPYYCEEQWHGAETHLVTSQVITAVKGDQP